MAEGASPSPQQLSDAAILLLAANLASIPDLSSLNALVAQYPDVLDLTSMLQVLLKVLPETTLPEDYLGIVYRLSRREPEPLSSYQIPPSYIHEVARLSQKSIRSKLGDFNLEPPTNSHEDVQQTLVQWFFDRARRIEQETGMIELARRLVVPNQNQFNQDPPFPPSPVTSWGDGVVKVLERFIFENNDEDELQLSAFENLDPESAVRLLLSRTTPDVITRTFRELIKPFITYKQLARTGGESLWATVWEWFLDRVAEGDLSYVANLAQAWNEEDGELVKEFLATCLAACYLCHKSSSKVRSDLHRIDNFLSRFSAYFEPGGDIRLTHPETDFLSSELRNSPLTALTISALQFLNAMIISADIVAQLTSPALSLKELAMIHEESPQTQTQLAERLLRGDPNRPRRTDEQWKSLRQSLKQLRNQTGTLGKLSEESLDTMVFVSMLDACDFGLAREIFVRSHALPAQVVEKTILEVFYRFYDNATSGNRTRGGMKNAFQTLQVLDDPSSTPSTSHAVKLVSATHALSSYTFTLSPGVTPTPLQIRLHKDPALLVSRVIQSNPSTYREGDRMLKILNDLIDGTQLFSRNIPEMNLETSRMQARVNAEIVYAALRENEFTIAYESCVNKLAPLVAAFPNDSKLAESAWVAYYRTGIYSGLPSPTYSTSATSLIEYQKMEVLARALLICPKEELEGILQYWTQLESKMLHPEYQHRTSTQLSDSSSARHRTFLETAAQVGRSVARTARASPLLSGGESLNGTGGIGTSEGRRSSGESARSSSRVGVRDTVRTGITQGIGWLIGATQQPPDQDE